jgi:colanic acid/amylovoran biosynthesis glycosyltransferase
MSIAANARVAYVVSGFPVSWIVSEVESHRQAGWEILPLSSSSPIAPGRLGKLELQWRDRTIYRPGLLAMLISSLTELARHPLASLGVLVFLAKLLIQSRREFAKALYELPVAAYFAGHCRRVGIQHIHVHFASRSLSLGIMLQILTGTGLSCTVHAFDIFTRTAKDHRIRLERCQTIVAISQYNIEYLRALCGRAIQNLCRLNYLGVDMSHFASPKRQVVPGRMISISNLVDKKGLDVAIRACAMLRDEGVKFELLIVGDGPLHDRLAGLIGELGLQDSVKLLGRKPNDQLVPLLETAAALVMPCVINPSGDRDGIPVAMMEAMACQVPVVSTWVSGIPELVLDGVTGRLVAERDPRGLADALGELLHDEAMIQRMGLAARKRIAERFNLETNAAALRLLILAPGGTAQGDAS